MLGAAIYGSGTSRHWHATTINVAWSVKNFIVIGTKRHHIENKERHHIKFHSQYETSYLEWNKIVNEMENICEYLD